MTIYSNIPYTYLIGWTKHNKWYYGARWSRSCKPSDLWNPYKTSSNEVKRFIELHGDPDVIQVRKIFCTIKEVRDWEEKVLRRLNNKDPFHSPTTKWLNKNPAASPPIRYGYTTKGNTGKKFSLSHRNKISEALKGKKRSEKTKQLLSSIRKGKPAHNKGKPFSEEARRNMAEAQKKRPPITQETRNKLSEITRGEGNPNFGKKHSSETKALIGQRTKDTSWFNDGVKNYRMKTEEALLLGLSKGRIKKVSIH